MQQLKGTALVHSQNPTIPQTPKQTSAPCPCPMQVPPSRPGHTTGLEGASSPHFSVLQSKIWHHFCWRCQAEQDFLACLESMMTDFFVLAPVLTALLQITKGAVAGTAWCCRESAQASMLLTMIVLEPTSVPQGSRWVSETPVMILKSLARMQHVHAVPSDQAFAGRRRFEGVTTLSRPRFGFAQVEAV